MLGNFIYANPTKLYFGEEAQKKYTGGGNIKCHAVDNLMLSGLGCTKIEYLGTPKIKSRGTVKPHKLHMEYND